MQKVWTVDRMPMSKEETLRHNELFQEAETNRLRFVAVKERIFEARKIEIITQKKMSLNIPGRKGSLEGFYLVSRNIANPKPLSITIQRGALEQNPDKKNNFFMRDQGMISVSGEKSFDPLEKLEQSKGKFQKLPVKDPDLTSLDGMEFRQTGTLQVIISQGALIILS